MMKWFEKFYPYFIAVIISIFSWGCFDLIKDVKSYHIDINSIFSSFFNMLSIFTSFLFTFYGFTLASGGGFLEKILTTIIFKKFVTYVAESLSLGGIAVLLTIPLIATDFSQVLMTYFWKIYLSLWVFFFIAALLSFYRVIRIFLVWSKANSG